MNPEVETATTFYLTSPDVHTWNPILKQIIPLIKTQVDRQISLPLFKCGSYVLQGSPRNGQTANVIISEEEGLEVHTKNDLFLARCYKKRELEGNDKWLKK